MLLLKAIDISLATARRPDIVNICKYTIHFLFILKYCFIHFVDATRLRTCVMCNASVYAAGQIIALITIGLGTPDTI